MYCDCITNKIDFSGVKKSKPVLKASEIELLLKKCDFEVKRILF